MSENGLDHSLAGSSDSQQEKLSVIEHTLVRGEKTVFDDIGYAFYIGVIDCPIRFKVFWRKKDSKWILWSDDLNIPKTGISSQHFGREYTFGRHETCSFTTANRQYSMSTPQFSVSFQEGQFTVTHQGRYDTTVKTHETISSAAARKAQHHGTVKELPSDLIEKLRIESAGKKATEEIQVVLGISGEEQKEEASANEVVSEITELFLQGKGKDALEEWTKASILVKWRFSDLQDSPIPELDILRVYRAGGYRGVVQALQILTTDKYCVTVEQLADGSLRYCVNNINIRKKVENLLKAAKEVVGDLGVKVRVPLGFSLDHLQKCGASEVTADGDPSIEDTRDWLRVNTTDLDLLRINIIRNEIFYFRTRLSQ